MYHVVVMMRPCSQYGGREKQVEARIPPTSAKAQRSTAPRGAQRRRRREQRRKEREREERTEGGDKRDTRGQQLCSTPLPSFSLSPSLPPLPLSLPPAARDTVQERR